MSQSRWVERDNLLRVTSPTKPLPVGSKDFAEGVAEGLYDGWAQVTKFGANLDVDAGTVPEDVWTQGGLHVPPTTPRVHELVSDNVADTAAGTGAQAIRVEGIDANGLFQSLEYELNGVTPVLTAPYWRIFRMFVTRCGSGEVNAGLISATAQVDGTITAVIGADVGQTEMAIYTVPLNQRGRLLNLYASIHRQAGTAGLQMDVALYFREGALQGNPVRRIKHRIGLSVEGTSESQHSFRSPLLVAPGTDVILRVTDNTDNNSRITGGFDMLLEDLET